MIISVSPLRFGTKHNFVQLVLHMPCEQSTPERSSESMDTEISSDIFDEVLKEFFKSLLKRQWKRGESGNLPRARDLTTGFYVEAIVTKPVTHVRRRCGIQGHISRGMINMEQPLINCIPCERQSSDNRPRQGTSYQECPTTRSITSGGKQQKRVSQVEPNNKNE